MPISKLFIEGNLENEVLNRILAGNPVLQRGGSKNSLRPRARAERDDNNVAAGYLRDRDFDFDPPDDVTKPTIDQMDGNVPFGWRWARHEIENYLIDPAVVSEATTWPIGDVVDALRQAATIIRSYEAARWTVGRVRRSLPPQFQLHTRPDGLSEIGIPGHLDLNAVSTWALQSIANHRDPIMDATEPHEVQTSLAYYDDFFGGAFVDDPSRILLWFSGKDLLAAMADWLTSKNVLNPGAFRAQLRDWIIAHPDRTLDLLPEWNAMIGAIRA